MEFEIRFIENAKMESIMPLLLRLDPEIPSDVLKNRLKDMILHGYQCVGVFERDKLIGISGIWLLMKYYIGKHIELDNVCILPEYRDKGIGKVLIEWISDYAKSVGCEAAELNCYTKNEPGQRFWKNQGYEAVGYHFRKKFKQ